MSRLISGRRSSSHLPSSTGVIVITVHSTSQEPVPPHIDVTRTVYETPAQKKRTQIVARPHYHCDTRPCSATPRSSTEGGLRIVHSRKYVPRQVGPVCRSAK